MQYRIFLGSLFLALTAASMPCVAIEKGDVIGAAAVSDIVEFPGHEFTGRVTYIDFWASWCGPCRQSLPWIKRLEEKFGKEGLRVVTVNLDSDRAAAESLLDDVGLSRDFVWDPEGKIAERFKLKSMPTSILVGPDGRVAAVYSGFRAEHTGEIEREISELLEHGTEA